MSSNGLKHTFRAFRNRNYTLYFTGQSVSLIGTWMQGTGVSWVVYTMTHSTVMLGLTVFATLFPRFLLSLLGGIVADRYNRYKILLITQTASMIQAFILAVITLSNHYTIGELLALSAMLGTINAFDSPARQPMVHEMVNNKDDLPNALALNSSVVNFARIVGPALSGIILEKFGAGICFLINAISFVTVLISLLMMKLPPCQKPVSDKKNIATDLKEGFGYLMQTPLLGKLLIMVSLVSLLVMPYDTLLPVFAKVIFKGDATTFGYIRSFIGLGAIIGAFFLAALRPDAHLKKILMVNTLILGIGLILFSHTTNFPLAMFFAIVFGFGAMSQTTISLTIVQMYTDARMRGRVMSYLIMALAGMVPLGSLAIGYISAKIGASNTLLIEGFLAICIAALFAKYLRKRPMGTEELLSREVVNKESVPKDQVPAEKVELTTL